MPVWRGCCPLALASRQWNESISGSVSSPTACFMGLFCNSPMSSVRAPFRQKWIKHLSSTQWHPAFIQGEEGWGQVTLVISDFCCILAQFSKVNETLAENMVCFGSWDYVPGVLLKKCPVWIPQRHYEYLIFFPWKVQCLALNFLALITHREPHCHDSWLPAWTKTLNFLIPLLQKEILQKHLGFGMLFGWFQEEHVNHL